MFTGLEKNMFLTWRASWSSPSQVSIITELKPPWLPGRYPGRPRQPSSHPLYRRLVSLPPEVLPTIGTGWIFRFSPAAAAAGETHKHDLIIAFRRRCLLESSAFCGLKTLARWCFVAVWAGWRSRRRRPSGRDASPWTWSGTCGSLTPSRADEFQGCRGRTSAAEAEKKYERFYCGPFGQEGLKLQLLLGRQSKTKSSFLWEKLLNIKSWNIFTAFLFRWMINGMFNEHIKCLKMHWKICQKFKQNGGNNIFQITEWIIKDKFPVFAEKYLEF